VVSVRHRPTVDGDTLSPTGFVEVVVQSLRSQHELAPSTLFGLPPKMQLFAAFCERGLAIADVRHIDAEHARAFVFATRSDGTPAAPAWMHVRRGAVRLLFKEGRRLSLVDVDPTLDLELPPRSAMATRPLTDDEIELCRACARESLADLRGALCWALSEASARPCELARVRVNDVDLEGESLRLHGDPRALPRWVSLTDWGLAQVRRALEVQRRRSSPDDLLIPFRQEAKAPQTSASMAVIRTLKAAGLHDEPDVRPRSVTAWAGSRALRDGATIDEVARMLGMRSLGQTATLIGFDWRPTAGDPG
jgi:integrase/recombinase XerC